MEGQSGYEAIPGNSLTTIFLTAMGVQGLPERLERPSESRVLAMVW